MDNIFRLEKQEEYKAKLDELVQNLYGSSEDSSLNAVKEEFKDLLLQTKFQPNRIEEILLSKGHQIDRVQYFLTVLEKRKNKLFHLALTSHNSSYGEVVDSYDWALKFVSGTSELQTLKYPILQFAINYYKNAKPAQKLFDIDKDTLIKLIRVLNALDLSS